MTEKEITKLLKHSGAAIVSYTRSGIFASNGIDVEVKAGKSLDISKAPELVVNGKLIVEFSSCTGDFLCRNMGLITLKGMPNFIFGGYFDCSINPIESYEFAPRKIEKHMISNVTNITSLEGVSDNFEKIDGNFFFNERKIISGGLGLLNISGIKSISNYTMPFQIIEKYLGTDNIIECQSELIEAGYEAFAIL